MSEPLTLTIEIDANDRVRLYGPLAEKERILAALRKAIERLSQYDPQEPRLLLPSGLVLPGK